MFQKLHNIKMLWCYFRPINSFFQIEIIITINQKLISNSANLCRKAALPAETAAACNPSLVWPMNWLEWSCMHLCIKLIASSSILLHSPKALMQSFLCFVTNFCFDFVSHFSFLISVTSLAALAQQSHCRVAFA